MTRPDPHQRYEELAAGHALSALEPEDEQAFLAHVGGCAQCERDLVEHQVTLSHLAYAPQAAEPPPSLLEGIRAGVLASGRAATFPDDAVQDLPGSQPSSLDEARRRRAGAASLRRAGVWTGVAAAFALVVSLGVWNVDLRSDRDAQLARGDRLAAAVQDMGQPGAETVSLTGTGGSVVAVALMRDEEVSLLVDGLEPNDAASTTYVLWGRLPSGDVRGVTTFDVTDDGLQVDEGLSMPVRATDLTELMVTFEQGRVVPSVPTLPVLASGQA